MILDLDLGNSSAKWRVQTAGKTIAGRFVYADIDAWLAALPVSPDRLRVCSVLSFEKQVALLNKIETHLNLTAEVAHTSRSAVGVQNGYEDFSCLGVDRWLAIVAAWQRSHSACVVVDAGTAVTIDYLDGEGRHLGGYIVPGLAMMCAALTAGTDGILVGAAEYALSPGVNTQQAVGHGSLLAVAAAINDSVRRFEKCCAKTPQLLLTGGDALLLQSALEIQSVYCPELVFEGLACVLP